MTCAHRERATPVALMKSIRRCTTGVARSMTWSIIFRERDSGRIAIAVATKFFAVGARVPVHRAAEGRRRHPGAGQPALRNRWPQADPRRRRCRRRHPHPHRARCRPRASPAPRAGRRRPVRRLHRRRVRAVVRPLERRGFLGRGQHAGRAAGRVGDRARAARALRSRAAAAPDRSPEGRREGRRRQARQAIGGAGDLWRRRAVRARPSGRRPCRAIARAGAAGIGEPRGLDEFPPLPADARRTRPASTIAP